MTVPVSRHRRQSAADSWTVKPLLSGSMPPPKFQELSGPVSGSSDSVKVFDRVRVKEAHVRAPVGAPFVYRRLRFQARRQS